MSLEGLFLLLLAFIILSLTYCCCGKEFNRRTKEKYTKREKIFALSAAFTLLMVQIIAVVVGVLSTKNIIDGVNISASSIASIATDYQTLNSGLPLLINTTVNQIDGVVSATFAATAVDSSWSNSLDITELTNGINQLERISSSISAVSTLLDLEIADYQNSAIFVGFTASTLMSQIYTFNGVHATTSGTFKLNPSFQYAITDLSTIVPLDSSSLTPISSTISTYFGVTQVLSLVALRASLNSSYTTRVNTGKNILAASLTNVQRSIQSNIVKKKNSILNSTVFISNLASETLYTQVQIPPITGTLLMVGAYLLWILLGVIIIDLIIIIAGIVKRRDRISRTCTICTPVSRVIIHVLLLVFFTTSIILGDVCTFVFTENLQSMGAGTSSSFAALRGMSDNCISGTGFQDTSLDIPQVIGSLVFSDSTWTNSLKSIAISNQVAPLTPLISSIDPLYPASVTKLLVSMGSLSCLNYQIPSTAFNTYTNLLITNTTVGFSGPNTTWFTFNSTLSGVNDPALQAAIALMSGEISNIKSSAQSLTIRNSSSNLTSLLTSRDRINGYILNLTAQIASYKTLSTSLITLYNTLNSTEAWTAGLKSRYQSFPNSTSVQVKTSCQPILSTLASSFNCSAVALDLTSSQNGVCGVFKSGIDSLWISLLILAINGFLCLPVYIMAVNYICKPQVIVDKELGKFMSEKPDHEQSGSGTKMLDTNLSTKSLKNDKNIVESRETESALSSPMTPAPQYGLDSLSNPSNHIYSKVAIIVQDVPDYESPNTYNFNQQAIQNDDELELQQGFNQAYESNANNQNVYEYMNDIDESVPVHISNTDHYQHQVEVYQHVDIKSQEFQVQAVTLEVKNQVEYIPWESIPQEEHQEHQGYVPEPNYETENFPRLYDQTVAYELNDFNKQENNTEPLSHDNIDPQSFVQESFIQDYPQEVQQQGVYQIQDFDQIPESEFAPAPPPPPPPPPALVQTARKWPTVEAQEPIFKWGSKKATEYFSFKEEDSEELQESNQGIPSALGFSNGSNEV